MQHSSLRGKYLQRTCKREKLGRALSDEECCVKEAVSLSSHCGHAGTCIHTLSLRHCLPPPPLFVSFLFTLPHPHPAISLFSLPTLFPPSLCHPLFLFLFFSHLPLPPYPHLRDCISTQLHPSSFLSSCHFLQPCARPPPPHL